MEIDIEFWPDGQIMVKRGSKAQNDVVWEIFNSSLKNQDDLKHFLSVTDKTDIIFGDSTFCG